ncbi:D-alanine--D-alanine ligase [Paenibacillus sp. alder61]|uniref:D-alanine--D-alanine ligase n=1 Tax=Paenibacillus sp. alder61 TaxID=2862948 RepID=UPI001CD63A6A|nr:D-alanine--D-alanine ligase [Paenibacillus sp. alder61]MCA1293385.1 D-alanine--D-alanine ligase [Paenibacillus sp. alder61]
MRVGIIMGGVSSEYEVSLMTGREMVAHLDRKKYDVLPIIVTKREELIDRVRDIDFALLALHGAFGEDGTVQGALETLGVPYSGSGVLSSSLCMDKDLSKMLMRAEGIPTPDWRRLSLENWQEQAAGAGFPVFVKPNNGGSSIGVRRADHEEDLYGAVTEAFRWDRTVIVESMIEGQEITCSIVDGEFLPVLGIRAARADWFDYDAKYTDGGAEEAPISLPHEVYSRVRETALACCRLFKCGVYARIDMILHNDTPFVLEVNTLPGMTKTSLLPRSAEAAGWTYAELLDRIIEGSLRERGKGGKRDDINE